MIMYTSSNFHVFFKSIHPIKIINGNTLGIIILIFVGVLIFLSPSSILGQSQAYFDGTFQTSVMQIDTSYVVENEKIFLKQKYLTGNWWGGRSNLETRGVNFDLRYTSSYQGLICGTREINFDYGGKVDAFIKLDTEKMHLWKGGGFRVHIEYAHGALNPVIGGVLFSENAAQFWPVASKGDVVGASLYFTQKFSNKFNLALGKFNPVDLLAADLFFGGWGIDRFMNLIFVAPPSGLVPPIFVGGIFNYKIKPIALTLMVFDPDDRTNNYFSGDLFSNGASFSLSGIHRNTIFDRKTTYSITATYSTEESPDYSYLQPGIETLATKNGSYNIAFQFTHSLQESTDNQNDVWSFYLRTAIADGNPNYVKASLVTGIGGIPLFFNRSEDSFGVGYFYYNLSNVLEDSLGPLEAITNESGLEIYYNFSVTPWLFIGADIQYIDPFKEEYHNALVGSLRTQIRI